MVLSFEKNIVWCVKKAFGGKVGAIRRLLPFSR